MSSMREVAKACRVSVATVSYVINDGPRSVAPATRNRVLKTMRDLNYRPRALHVGERAKRADTIGVLFTYRNDGDGMPDYFRPVLDGILPRAIAQDQNVLLFGQRDWSNAHRSLRNYCDGRCDGLLLLALPVENEIVPALQERGFPFVLLGSTGPEHNVSSVDMDNAAAARKITEYLLSLGHRRIAMVPGPTELWAAGQRLGGYCQALVAAGIPCDETLILREGLGYARGRRLAQMPSDKRPTAIFCGSDVIAMDIVRALQESGLRVPGDISVAGFDDIPDAASCNPPLTTVHQSLRQQGEIATDLLLDMIRHETLPGKTETLPTELVIRASVAPPPPTAA